MYVVLEGVDTCGKSTQIGLLKQRFPQAIFTKEPGGTALGLKLREMLLEGDVQNPRAELFLFLADRAEHIEQVIKPHQGEMIFSDRSLVSGIAYAKGFEMEWLGNLNRFATENFLPDLAVLLEIERDLLEERLRNKIQDGIEQRGLDYLLEIQERIKRSFDLLKIPWVSLSAALPPKDILDATISEIKRRSFLI